jgi:serine/threonine protein kinase
LVDSLDTLVHARHGPPPAHPGHYSTRPDPPETLLLGRYRLLERLGAGGFGVVWRAHDELLHREVALKRVFLGAGGGPIDSERATREALASARLAHPAIVALYEACAAGDAFYLISELVHGETLARLIAGDALTDEEVLEIGLALTDALVHAHARGVIHRDVKPQNVLVPDHPDGRGGVAKLTDFGGARLAGEDVLTRTGDVLGTLAYMAPEQSEGREAAEPADLYALALVLYEALTGVNPVRGSTPAATARRIGQAVAPLERRRRDLPRSLTRAIDRALVPTPGQRGTLEDLHLALGEALEHPYRPARRFRRGRASARDDGRPVRDDHDRGLERRAADPPRIIQRQPASSRDDSPVEGLPPVSRRRLTLPRVVWLVCALAAIVWQIWVGRPGSALLLLAAAVPLAFLPRRSGPGWLMAALAPVLGLAGLAGAFPALAGQRARFRERAALAALGYWWLTLAEPLLDRRLWLGSPAGVGGIPNHAVWEGSLGSAAAHVVGPTLSLSVLFGASVWAAGAVLLPWVVRGRSAVLDVVTATSWAALLLVASSPRQIGLYVHVSPAVPRGAILGALLGGMLAVAARALRGPV